LHYFGRGYVEEESQLPFAVGWLFDIAAGSDAAAEQLGITERQSAVLNKAADVVGRFSRNGNGGKSIQTAKRG
jgi:hypothetical protein